MPVSTTTFQERIAQIETRAAIADRAYKRRRRRSLPRPGPMVVLMSMGMLLGGTAVAWDGNTPAYDWALPGLEWALSFLP